MSLYAARKLVEAAFTASAVNTQVTALNTTYGTSANSLVGAVTGNVDTMDDASFPAIGRFVGFGTAPTEVRRVGKRDLRVPVTISAVSKHATLATAETDVEVWAEALTVVMETLPGLQYGSSARYCVDVQSPALSYQALAVDGKPVRVGVNLSFVMVMRAEGV